MSPVTWCICREILLRLPADSLLRLRAVCKQWRAAIDDPNFAKAHIDNQISSNSIIIRNLCGAPFYPLYHFSLEDLDFTDAQQTIPVTPLTICRGEWSRLKKHLPLSVCNGLMLIAPEQEQKQKHTDEVHWEVCNPLTGERLTLPDPNISLQVAAMGLGYDCVADDYRVVVIDYDGESTRKTHVYGLKSGSWREIGDYPFGLQTPDTQKGVFVNGSLHWVSCDFKIIIAFDFATEKYSQLALPPGLLTTPESVQLESLGGCLFLTCIGVHDRCGEHSQYGCNTKCFDLWAMNDSWIKLFSLKEKHRLRFSGNNTRFVAYMKNKNRVLMQHENSFLWFDIGSNSSKMVDIHGFTRHSAISAQPFVGSLLRHHDSCGRDASRVRTMKRTKIKNDDTKLTFCVRDPRNYENRDPRDYEGKFITLHDDCYNIDSNWFTYSCQGDEIQTASTYPDSVSFIPLDICREIFLHLPAKSLIRFRAGCKSYRDIIDEPCFATAHTNKQPLANTILIKNSSGPPFYPLYSFDLDALNFTNELQRMPTTPLGFAQCGLSHLSASMCNSLILIADKKWEIWNPLTNECLQLPRGEFNSDVAAIGIGYDYTSDDYKVVCIDRSPPQNVKKDVRVEYVYRTHVYSLRSDSWKMVGNCPIDVVGYILSGPDGPGVSLCGALHWTSWGMDKIIALDLRTENYSELKWPPLRTRSSIVDIKRYLDLLGGCLVMIDYVIAYGGGDDYMDVWVMKDYGAEDSWVNAFSIIDYKIYGDRNIRPIAYMKNESQILLQNGKGLFLYDDERDSLKKCNIHGLTVSSYAHAFTGSIFRLHDNCGVSGSGSGSFTRQRTRIKKRAPMEISDTELYFCVGSGFHETCPSLDINSCCWSSDDED